MTRRTAIDSCSFPPIGAPRLPAARSVTEPVARCTAAQDSWGFGEPLPSRAPVTAGCGGQDRPRIVVPDGQLGELTVGGQVGADAHGHYS